MVPHRTSTDSFLARFLIWPCFLFSTKLFLSFLTTDGQLCFSFKTIDSRVGNPLGFSYVYGILPFIIASFGRFGLLDGPGHLFDPFLTITRISLSNFVYVLITKNYIEK